MTGRPVITGALFIDLGEGFEIKSGARAGQIRWTREPRARFECLLCRTTETPTAGPKESIPAAVARFVASIRTDHRASCPATTQHHQPRKAA